MNARIGYTPQPQDPAAGQVETLDLTGDVVRLIEWITGIPDPVGRPASSQTILQAAETALISAVHAANLIAEQQHRIAQLESLAETDELTGLNNRRGFERELRRVQSAMLRYDEDGLMLYIDLDEFKEVNDTHGHAAGDAVLNRVAGVLASSVRETDSVARLGGDEFVVLLTHTSPEHARVRGEEIERALNGAFARWGHLKVPIRASVGMCPIRHDVSAEDLLHEADQAMYDCKRRRTLSFRTGETRPDRQ